MARLSVSTAREEMDQIDLEDARAALKEAEEKGTVPFRDLIRELGIGPLGKPDVGVRRGSGEPPHMALRRCL